ncbi:MAG: proline/glycine betaine ABC transporter permease [Syntrophomonadaceae bacterium]|nr:proline/glycine betaine ABC transporter permease [Syntrophomonadaceae bacterium]
MFPEQLNFHIAPCIDAFVRWMLHTWGPAFDAFSGAILILLVQFEKGLIFVPWWLWIVAIAAAGWWLTRRVGTTLLLASMLALVGVFGLWEAAMETLAIVLTATLLAVVIGIPLGIAMSESKRANTLVTPLLDAMQTMPSFVYLIPALMLFGLGKVPAVFATLIYALPPVVRLTDLGIRQVSVAVKEASVAFGATRWQLMKEVKLPLAMPSILAGVNQTIMMALAMVVIASMIGAGGVGEEVLLSINRIAVGKGFEAGLVVVALAIIIDRLTQNLTRRWQPPQAH